ncbi:MAG: flagellar motor switch protein FliN [Clostridiales bacterium]|jgi:flagellar motor switch protein FliN/FliY|nr:flagellar motor switch protein FliN [Clostridiales bacterium]
MNEALTQEEIDAILTGGEIKNNTEDDEMRALAELSAGCVSAISDMFASKVGKAASITVSGQDKLTSSSALQFENPITAYRTELHGGIRDKIYLYFDTQDADEINKPAGAEETKKDMLQSIIKDSVKGYAEKMSAVLGCEITADTPEQLSNSESYFKTLLQKARLYRVAFELVIEDGFKCRFHQVFPASFAAQVANCLRKDTPEKQDIKPEKQTQQIIGEDDGKGPVTVQSVSFPSFDDEENGKEYLAFEENIEFILDVPLNITVELGSTNKPIKDILSLNIGSIVELDNPAEDMVKVLVNGKLIARGEVIVVDENFGVRIRELFTTNQKSLLAGAYE